VVAGKVFKKVSDRIYNHFLSKPNFKNEAVLDTSVHNYFGIKNDMQSIFSGLGITYADSNASGLWRNASLSGKKATLAEPAELNTAQNIMPNFVGMGLKDALYLLENKGLTATISGKGKVISQSLYPGTSFKKGQKIILMLN
jgi:cell division protein FtsI (penicillin-binding protein 3)